MKKILIVFAMKEEAKNKFENENILFTGLGKVNAAYQLSKEIIKNRPDLIINLGSAGSNVFPSGTIVNCTKFIQRDMDASPIGFEKWQTPFEETPIVLSNGLRIKEYPEGICGSGDSFDITHEAKEYNVVDMESYALAKIAMLEGIPFICLKYISDGADGNAAKDWEAALEKTAEKLSEAYKKILMRSEMEMDG